MTVRLDEVAHGGDHLLLARSRLETSLDFDHGAVGSKRLFTHRRTGVPIDGGIRRAARVSGDPEKSVGIPSFAACGRASRASGRIADSSGSPTASSVPPGR